MVIVPSPSRKPATYAASTAVITFAVTMLMLTPRDVNSGPFNVRLLLFHVYSAGNYIETTADTRYFQIGESKYGKPIIDRVVKADTSLAAVAKCALISMDSTIRSNLSVGMPLDLAIVRRDAMQVSLHRSIGPEDPYFKVIRDGWGESLRNAFYALPDPSIP